ncbi:unnamed protein product, partial [Rotaria sp. Silwood2]
MSSISTSDWILSSGSACGGCSSG